MIECVIGSIIREWEEIARKIKSDLFFYQKDDVTDLIVVDDNGTIEYWPIDLDLNEVEERMVIIMKRV